MPDRLVCIGSYTHAAGGHGEGITAWHADGTTGALTRAGSLALPAPSWLQWHPALPILYATSELESGAVTAVAVTAGGRMNVLNSYPSHGASPCHLAVTPDGRHLLAANYGSGTVTTFGLADDGRIAGLTDLIRHHGSGPDPVRQDAAHPHMIVLADSGRLVSVVDLGSDQIRSYQLRSDGTLAPAAVSALPPGTGPRQLVRRPDSTRGWILAELAGTLLTVDEPSPGRFTVRATIASSETPTPNLPAQLTLSEDGRHAYVTNRGPNTITVFALDAEQPTLVGEYPIGAAWPRHCALIGAHLYLAAQHGDEAITFSVDQRTGTLSDPQRTPLRSPTCVAAAPARENHRT